VLDKLKIIQTDDGSSSIYNELLNENYHSTHGAIAESMHVYITHGLKTINKKSVRILEMGWGTGLNALLTLCYQDDKSIFYVTVEKFPLSQEVLEQLNYPNQLNTKNAAHFFKLLHQAAWEKEFNVNDDFILEKKQLDFIHYQSKIPFDIIYFDAFAPRVQPELWTLSMFEHCYHLLAKEGVLVTYCANGQVKRNMKMAGFDIIPLPGPPGKREMTKAVKK
jgi:tRNA U34 5-methylaminomethyl-2-thiouridine-forming methyltransferase MnmC